MSDNAKAEESPKSEPEFCGSRSPGNPETGHGHDCELSPRHKDRHACGCGTEWH